MLKEVTLGKRFTFGATFGALGLFGLLVYLYASRVAARSFRLERERVWLNTKNVTGIKASQSGHSARRLSILHLSDLHLSKGNDEMADFIRAITNDDYDMVVITGDIFEDEGGLAHAPSLLSKMPRLGAYAVLGNHDYYAYTLFNKTVGEIFRRYRTPSERRNIGPFVQALETQGYRVLRNEIVDLPEEKLSIVGIDYPTISRGKLDRLLAKVDREGLLIALAHVPKNLELLRQSGINLALAGHTHGGQVRLPGVGALVTRSELPRQEASGLIWRGETAVHVSRGLGADPRTNFRLFCPPAATVLEVMAEA